MKRSKSKPNYLRYVAILLAIVALVSGAFFGINLWDKIHGSFNETEETTGDAIVLDGKEYVLKDNLETMLVLGLDKFDNEADDSYNNDKQADFLMLMVIDNDNKTCTGIQINRDTMTEINVLDIVGNKIDTVTKQIALAHTYGKGNEVSCRNTADAVSELLKGVDVNHYVSVSMDAIPVLNGAVGGVEVEITEDFSGVDKTLVMGETVTLNGDQVMNYVRGRYGVDDSTNESRMKRQQKYLISLFNEIKNCSKQDEGFISNTLLSVSNYIISDCSVNKMEYLYNKVSDYEFKGIKTIEGKSVKGEEYMEFYSDEKSLNQLVADCFYNVK